MNWQRRLLAGLAALIVGIWGSGNVGWAAGPSIAVDSLHGFTLPAQAETYTGYFGVLWGDGGEGSGLTAETYWLDDGAGLHLRLELVPELAEPWGGPPALNGRQVTVSGTRAGLSAQGGGGEVLEVESLQPAGLEAADVGAQAVTGSQPWVSILCAFPDKPASSTTLAYFQGMYASTYPALDHYWREVSYNNINVVGSTAVGWYTLPQPWSYYVHDGSLDHYRAAYDCTALAEAAVDFRPFVGINLMFNSNLDGYAWGGSEYLTLDGVSKSWRMTWEPPWGWQNISVIEHEMGHGFGLPHSSGMYGDTYDNSWDVMSDTWGNCSPSHPTYRCMGQHTIAPYKDRLGWIPADKKITLPYQAQATLTLEKLALPQTNNYRLVRIPTCNANRYYTVEARRDGELAMAGYDSILPGAGIIVHRVDSNYAYVVDRDLTKPTSNANMTPGVTYTISTATESFTLTVDSDTGTGYVVTIANTAPCTPPDPPTLLSPAAGAYWRQRQTGFFWQPSASPNQTYFALRVSTSADPDSSPWQLYTYVYLPASAYTYTFGADGAYYWHVRATNSGNLNSTWVSRAVTIDTVNPTAAFAPPTVSNAYLNTDSITIRATAADSGSGVDRVDFSVGYGAPTNWLSLGTDSNGADGWSYPLVASARGIADQTTLAFRIRAYDRAGNASAQVDATGISLDRAAPSSAVSPLPPASLALFNVTWGGADATSGVASYDVQYRVDGGAWVDWQMQTTSTQALFVSAAPHTYGFRSRATDRAGNVEAWPGSPDTTTTVSTAPERVYVPLVAQP